MEYVDVEILPFLTTSSYDFIEDQVVSIYKIWIYVPYNVKHPVELL